MKLFTVTSTELVIDRHGKSTGYKAHRFHDMGDTVEIRPIQGKVLGKTVWAGKKSDFQAEMAKIAGVA